MNEGRPGAARATLAGLCASLVGVGLARFAYTPLIPALIAAAWFTPAQAAYIGAVNLAGYLAGALSGRRIAGAIGARSVLRGMMVVASVAFFACSGPLSFLWFLVWRFAAGLAGGILMVLAAPSVLPLVSPARRGLASGLIFTGVGLGIAASGTLVPLLLSAGLTETWCGLGALASVLTLFAWTSWPSRSNVRTARPEFRRDEPGSHPALRALYVEYGLNAVGAVPHMVFLVDFVARGLNRGLEAGAVYWLVFGVGAVAGALLTGSAADRVGFRAMLRLAFVVQAIGSLVLAFAPEPFALGAASLVLGAFVPGVVPLVLGRVQELTPGDSGAQQAGWSFATAAFALGQAIAAYGFSFLFARGTGYPTLFVLGAAAMLLALAIDFAFAHREET
ncbi:MAG: YbfB/YjiJ family MFS transporter [Acetobacteraceae bacterium]|nr:YbfB/YjiJ family MFS transporter [Acetobacteraceae bacterium]